MPREMHPENLVPVTKRSKSEAREISRNGGIKSGESRRLNSALKRILSLRVPKDEERSVKNTLGITDKLPITHWEVVAMKLIEKARRGDVKAIRVLAEITGDLDKQVQMDVTTNGSPLDIFAGLSNRQIGNIIDKLAKEDE